VTGRLLRALAAGLVLAALASGCTVEEPVQVATAAPPLAGTDFAGEAWDVENLAGSVVLVTMWASWCAPCREEVPVLDRAQELHAARGLVVLGVNTQDSADAAQGFLAAEQPAFPSVVDPDGTIAVEWGVRGLPESFLVDRSGKVVARRTGPVDDAWITEVVVPVVTS
jgi:DsbE subfamily thiol:disulfide oxidoreductase